MADIDRIPAKFRWCRDIGHGWKPWDVHTGVNNVTRRREVARVLTCQRCETQRTDFMATDGEVLRRSYAYPSGYLLDGAGGPMTKAERKAIRVLNTRGTAYEVQRKKGKK